MSPEEMKASYVRVIEANAETVIFRRAAGPSLPAVDMECRARIMAFDPGDVAGAVQQGDRKLIVLADDLADFPLPLQVNKDRVAWNGKTLVIKSVDEATRRVQGVLIAYEIAVAGA